MAVTSFRVTGDWRHVIDDGMVDDDALPDEALPTGHVVFTPVSPSVAVDGAPAIAHTLAEVKALISAGELNDLQGREGVYLVGKIGGITVRWRAVTHLYFQGVKVDYPPLVFDLTEDARLTGLIQNSVPGEPPMVIDPRIEALIEDAQEVLADAQAAIAGLNESEANAVAAAEAAAVSEGNAEQFAVDAESSASAASGSATASAGSAASAAGSAGTAGDHRVAAETARGGAETARTGAETARTQAESEANRAQDYADNFGLSVTGTSTGAEGSNASVTVSGEGPSYGLTFTIPRGDTGPQGDPGEVTQAMLDASVASLVDGAPEALNTLDELATALGNDPNFATTVSTEIGLRAKTADVNSALEGKANTTHTHTTGQVSGLDAALSGKADSGAENTATWSGVSGKPSTFPPSTHSHPVGQLSATGTASASTYLRGDGSWATPTNTTYSVPTQAEAEAGTATTGRAFSAQRARQSANAAIAAKFQVVTALPGSPDPNVIYLIQE